VSFKQAMEQMVPMKRYALAEEIAATAAWILSDEVLTCTVRRSLSAVALLHE